MWLFLLPVKTSRNLDNLLFHLFFCAPYGFYDAMILFNVLGDLDNRLMFDYPRLFEIFSPLSNSSGAKAICST